MYKHAIQQYLNQHGYEALKPRAVLFDMDGVLFDSMPLHARAWEIACDECGLPMMAHEAYLQEGRTGAGTINLLSQRHRHRDATPEEIEAIYAIKCKHFNTYPEARTMSGADEVLSQVKAAGLKIVLVTGSGQTSLLERLESSYPGYFSQELLVTGFDVKYGKPHPEPYLMGLEKAGIKPWEALVVENAPLGVQSAVGAHIFTIGVNTGPLDPEVLTNAGAHILYNSMIDFAHQWHDLADSLGL